MRTPAARLAWAAVAFAVVTAGCALDSAGAVNVVVGYQSKTINTVTAGTLLRGAWVRHIGGRGAGRPPRNAVAAARCGECAMTAGLSLELDRVQLCYSGIPCQVQPHTWRFRGCRRRSSMSTSMCPKLRCSA
jgi:hypothetical protein